MTAPLPMCPLNVCANPLDGSAPHPAHPGALCSNPYCLCDAGDKPLGQPYSADTGRTLSFLLLTYPQPLPIIRAALVGPTSGDRARYMAPGVLQNLEAEGYRIAEVVSVTLREGIDFLDDLTADFGDYAILATGDDE